MHLINIIGLGIIISILVFAAFLIRGISELENEVKSSEEKKAKACERCANSVGIVNVVGNILMILIKGYLGVVGRSKGLIADAIHSGADLLATIVMIIGIKVSDKETDKDYPFGYGKVEYIVSIVIYLFLVVIAIYIIHDGILFIIEGRQIQICLSAIWGAIFAIVINELMFRQSLCAGKKINSPSMVAKAWESRSDVYASIAVLIGILGAKMGFHFMDPLAAIAVGVIIIKMCIEMIKDASVNLMDKSPDESVIREISKVIVKVENISGIKNIFARELGRYKEFEIEVFVVEDISVEQGEIIKNNIKHVISDTIDSKAIVNVRLYAIEIKSS